MSDSSERALFNGNIHVNNVHWAPMVDPTDLLHDIMHIIGYAHCAGHLAALKELYLMVIFM
jgi:hypothetical protein